VEAPADGEGTDSAEGSDASGRGEEIGEKSESQTGKSEEMEAMGESEAVLGRGKERGDGSEGDDGAESGVPLPANGHAGEHQQTSSATCNDDLGDVFGRVLALSMTLNYPAFARAREGFADRDRVYLVYPDEEVRPLSSRPGGIQMDEAEALNLAVQVCQAVSFVHRRGLRVNDICPESVAYGAAARIKLTGLDYISNDNELQSEPIFNDGYTAPEIYRGKKVDKRADVFSIGALLYTCVTGERLDCETWREEAGPIRFYPPHVVTPALEQAIRRALMFDSAARWPSVEAFKAELVGLASTVRVRADALTDVGMVREHNEDAVLTFECRRDSLVEPAQIFLYVVADGMGGAEAGEVASAIAVAAIRNYVEDKLATAGAGDVRAIVQQALEHANSKILEYQTAHPEARSMGSTAVAALIVPPEAAIAWVGDSRAYVCDGNGLHQLTKDHSLVQRLIEIGQISADEARHHEHKNVITRSLGARPTGPAGAESLALRLKRGDRLMLCSDGLTAHVEDRQIEEFLRRHSEPTAAARELVVAANAGGGTDNVSVVVILAG
jgi:protein phosphatase